MHWFCRLKSSIMSSLRVGTITVIGRDKSGVVAKVTHCLFVQGANILALEEQVTRRAIQHDPSGVLACQPMESQVDPGRSQGPSQCPGDGNQG